MQQPKQVVVFCVHPRLEGLLGAPRRKPCQEKPLVVAVDEHDRRLYLHLLDLEDIAELPCQRIHLGVIGAVELDLDAVLLDLVKEPVCAVEYYLKAILRCDYAELLLALPDDLTALCLDIVLLFQEPDKLLLGSPPCPCSSRASPQARQ